MDEKDIQPPLLRKIVRKERMEGGELQLTFNSQSCFHCVTTRCATVCPTGSILRDTETGIVIHDNAPCIGCGKCATACPFGAIFFNTDHIIQKCDGCIDRVRQGLLPVCGQASTQTGCIDRVRQGLLPVCVEACPQQALEWEPGTK